MKSLDESAAQIESSDAWNDDDDVVEIEVQRPLDIVVPVQFSSPVWRELREAAREAGVGPHELLHTWALERLRARRVGSA